MNPDAIYPIPNLRGRVHKTGVNLLTGDANLSFPIGAISGRRLQYQVSLFFNSLSVWNASPEGNTVAGHGWKILDYPKIVQDGADYFFLDGRTAVKLTSLGRDRLYSCGAPYNLWLFEGNDRGWTVTTDSSDIYVLENQSTLATGPIWHLSTIRSKLWQSQLTFTYSGHQISTITSDLNHRLQFIYQNGLLVGTKTFFERGNALDEEVTLLYQDAKAPPGAPTDSSVKMIKGIVVSNRDADIHSVAYQYNGVNITFLNSEGAGLIYERTGPRARGTIIFPKTFSSGEPPITTCLTFDYTNIVMDDVYSQFNKVIEKPGSSDGFLEPYGSIEHYQFTKQNYSTLKGAPDVTGAGAATVDDVLVGLPYLAETYTPAKQGVAKELLTRERHSVNLETDANGHSIPRITKTNSLKHDVSQTTEYTFKDYTISPDGEQGKLLQSTDVTIRNPLQNESVASVRTSQTRTQYSYCFEQISYFKEKRILDAGLQSATMARENSQAPWRVVGCNYTTWKQWGAQNTWAPEKHLMLTEEISVDQIIGGSTPDPASKSWLTLDTTVDRTEKGEAQTVKSADDLVSRVLFDAFDQQKPYASLTYPASSAPIDAPLYAYCGFEAYESRGTWQWSGGSLYQGDSYTGRRSYLGRDLSIRTKKLFDINRLPGDSYPDPMSWSYIVSAIVKPVSGDFGIRIYDEEEKLISTETTKIQIDGQEGWTFVQSYIDSSQKLVRPEIYCDEGAIDHVFFGPANGTFSTAVWDWSRHRVEVVNNGNGQIKRKHYAANGQEIGYSEMGSKLNGLSLSFAPALQFLNGLPTLRFSGPRQTSITLASNGMSLCEEFHSRDNSSFPKALLSEMTVDNDRLSTNPAVARGGEARAQFSGSPNTTKILDGSFALYTEIGLPKAFQTSESGPLAAQRGGIEFNISGDGKDWRRGDTLRLEVRSNGFALLNKTQRGRELAVTKRSIARTCQLLVFVDEDQDSTGARTGNLRVFADGLLLLSEKFVPTASTTSQNTITLFSSIPNLFFWNFFLIGSPVISHHTYDGHQRHLQTAALTSGDSVHLVSTLHGGALKTPMARTQPTLTQDADLQYQRDFAVLQDDMTVQGDITNLWPEAYRDRPFGVSTLYKDNPLMHRQSHGSGGDFTAGQKAHFFNFDSSEGQHFDFSQDELLRHTISRPDGLKRIHYANRGGDIFGRVLANDKMQIQTGYEYDDQVRPVATFYPNAYDKDNVLDRSAHFRKTTYDFLHPVTVEDSDSGKTRHWFDRLGRVRLIQDADGMAGGGGGYATYINYDNLGRLLVVGYLEGDTSSVSSADFDDPTWPSLAGSSWQNAYIYDEVGKNNPFGAGRLSRIESGNNQFYFYYDMYGRILTVAGEIRGSKDGTTESSTINYSYDLLGNIISVKTDIGETTYAYDALGRVISIGIPGNAGFYASYVYKNGSYTEYLNSGTIKRDVTLNSAGWVTEIDDNFFNQQLFYQKRLNGGAGYTNGQIASESSLFKFLNEPPPRSGYEFQYDGLGRLMTARKQKGDGTDVMIGGTESGYDSNGNILNLQRGVERYSFEYESTSNRLAAVNSAPLQHTASGKVQSTERINKIGYDPTSGMTDTLATAQGKTGLAYDALGQRILKNRGLGQSDDDFVAYFRGINDYPLMETIKKGDSKVQIGYVYGPSGLLAITSGGSTYYCLNDHQRSTRVVVTQDNTVEAYYTYTPFGDLNPGKTKAAQNVPVRYLFTGQEFDDEVGLYNFRARMYDPLIARFYSPDPKHQFSSPYIYSDNPISFQDPTGEFFVMDDLVEVGIGALAGMLWGAVTGHNKKDLLLGGLTGAIAGGASLFAGALGTEIQTGFMRVTGLAYNDTAIYTGVAGDIIGGAISGGTTSAGTKIAENSLNHRPWSEGVGSAVGLGAARGAMAGPISRATLSKRKIKMASLGEHESRKLVRQSGYWNVGDDQNRANDNGLDLTFGIDPIWGEVKSHQKTGNSPPNGPGRSQDLVFNVNNADSWFPNIVVKKWQKGKGVAPRYPNWQSRSRWLFGSAGMVATGGLSYLARKFVG